MIYKISGYSRWVRNITLSTSGEGRGEAYSSIVGGRNNTVSSCYGFIGGGGGHAPAAAGANYGNTIYPNAGHGVIGGGRCNYIGNPAGVHFAPNGFIGNGFCNRIYPAAGVASHGFIGNGTNNLIGSGNEYSSILNGYGNTVNTSFSSILGGNYNTISSGHSAILGGQNNNIVAGYPNSFIAGSGITVGPLAGNGIAGALNVNALWASNIPGPYTTVPIPLQTGTIWFGPAGVPGGKVLYIK